MKLLAVWLVALALTVPARAADAAGATTEVWVDVDTAIGATARDVDDGLALALALRSPELTVRGVSATYGNSSLATAVATSRDVLARFDGAHLAVHAGAAGPGDLGRETDAVRALAAELERRPLTVLALGPLTTVATLLLRRPHLAARIERIVAVAGRRPGQRFLIHEGDARALPDLNLELDAPAMATVVASRVPLALAPWEVASRVWITPADLDALAAAGPGGEWVAARSRAWSFIWRWVLGAPGFNPFDTLAVGYVARPELFETEPVALALETVAGERTWSRPAAERPQLVARPGGAQATWCRAARPAFKELLLARLR